MGSSRIPGAPASQFLARIGHDQPTWPLAGLGGYIETVFHDDFFIDDTNLKAPVYAIASGG